MSIATDQLPFFRAQWATRFTDSCVVKRETGESFSDITGVSTPTYTTQYSGACLVRPRSESDVVYGQEQVVNFTHFVYLPYTATAPRRGDLVDITSVTDGLLTGEQFVVNAVETDTYVTRRALYCQDIQSG